MIQPVDFRALNQPRPWLAAMVVATLTVGWIATAETDSTESIPWDQQAVTDLSKELAKGVTAIEDAFRHEPGNAMPTGDTRARREIKQDLRRLRREADSLAKQLESGEGREDTLNVFLKLQEITYYTANHGKRAALTQPTLDRVAEARDALTKLAPYYGETWKPVMNPH